MPLPEKQKEANRAYLLVGIGLGLMISGIAEVIWAEISKNTALRMATSAKRRIPEPKKGPHKHFPVSQLTFY